MRAVFVHGASRRDASVVILRRPRRSSNEGMATGLRAERADVRALGLPVVSGPQLLHRVD
jgi:hypothetical protein